MKVRLRIAAVAMAIASSAACAANYCGDLRNAYGPFDYNNAEFAPNLNLVERAHFTPEVERLEKGNEGTVGGDLDYTLRAFPNHPRALASMARLALRTKGSKASGMKFSFECYFDRAIRFKPNDASVRTIYGGFLSKRGRTDDALEQLLEAARLQPEDGTINYNLGLVFLAKKDYDNALIFAKKAYALEFPLQGLKTKLIEVGKWNDKPEQ